MGAYFDKRILRIFVLGIASGFPWVLIGSMLTLWLQEAGLSRANIGYAGAIYAAYSINFIWSPLIDRIKRPLGISVGQRKSWIILTQICMLLACIGVASTDPFNNANLTVLYCLAIAIASATQDIAIDAFRIDSIPAENTDTMSIGASMAIAGWHTGFSGLGAVALFAADSNIFNWSQLYFAAIPVFGLLAIFTYYLPEPSSEHREQKQQEIQAAYLLQASNRTAFFNTANIIVIISPLFLALWMLSGAIGIPDTVKQSPYYIPSGLLLGFSLLLSGIALLNVKINTAAHSGVTHTVDTVIATLSTAIVHPLIAFLRQNGTRTAIIILLFIVFFKIGEAFLGRMSLVFYKEIGFSNEDIAIYSKLVSWGVTVVFSIISGLFAVRFGLLRGLFIAGIAMAVSNLMFSVMAIVGPEEWLFGLTVVVDGFTSAWSNVAFVAFLSSLCNRAFTATQYALLASLGTLGRTFFASSSGQLVDSLDGDWALFFVITAAFVIPGLGLLYYLGRRYNNNAKNE